MQNVKTKDVLVYVTMPGIIPRIKQLISSGFAYISFLMAHIYYMARLLPQNHPYLQYENRGRFGIHHVIVEASRNLRFTRKNIDQIFIYFCLLSGVVMLVLQLVLAFIVLLMPSAMAFSWFDTANPDVDVAYNILDQIFGIPGVFCSSFTPANCTAYSADTNGPLPGAPPMPLPFHIALHSLFRFYSTGLLLIAVLIFLYFVVVITVETVTTGTPFGKRFQNVWVPVRLIMALGLLLPINYGLGSGQYIVLYAAKWGSSFATNGWEEYNTTVANHGMFSGGIGNQKPLGERYTTLAIPEAPSMAPVVEIMSIVHSCAYAYSKLSASLPNTTTGSGFYSDDRTWYSNETAGNYKVQPYFVKQRTTSMVAGPIGSTPLTGNTAYHLPIPYNPAARPTYLDALGFYYGSDIIIRFGERAVVPGLPPVGGQPLYTAFEGYVKPLCGDVRVPVGDHTDIGGAIAAPPRGGPDHMLMFFYNVILDMWFDDVSFRQFARAWVTSKAENSVLFMFGYCNGNELLTGDHLTATGTGSPVIYLNATECAQDDPSADWKRDMIVRYDQLLYQAVRTAWSNHVQNAVYANMHTDIIARGWGGAGIWYNKISEINGGWIDGVHGLPTFARYPFVMERVKEERVKHDENVEEPYMPWNSAPSGEEAPKEITVGELKDIAVPLGHLVHRYWGGDERDPTNVRSTYDNPFLDAIQRFLGISGLLSLRGANSHLHPLAQLSAVGKSLVDSAIMNIGTASGAAFLGGIGTGLGNKGIEGAGQAASRMFSAIAFIGLSAGVVLYYVLPFLPFVYFYFAVASWVKAIFEAMVGVPLWALAHLRIDGDGLPGDAAQNGYFLILEIFIRPILTVVGLVAAVAVFGTQVRVLNIIWDLVTTNAAGYTDDYVAVGPNAFDIMGMNDVEARRYQRGIVDQFFFTVIYTVVCYMMALASFKLIDKIPDNILRWAGAGVSSFGDMDQDNIDSLSRYATMGTMTLGSQAVDAVTGASGKMGGALGAEMKAFQDAGGKGPAPGGGRFMGDANALGGIGGAGLADKLGGAGSASNSALGKFLKK